MNKICLVGNLTMDPEVRQTGSGVSVCTFNIAVNRRFANQNGEREADFIPIVTWRGLADNCGRYLAKGRKVAVVGSLQTRRYEDKQGNKRTAFEIVASDVSFCGSKRESGSTGSSYGTYGSAPAPQQPAYQEPAPAYSSGSSADFEELLGDDDLPF